jgi:hypothetical protein
MADIEALSSAAEMSILPPSHVSLHLICCVESSLLDQAFGKTQCHGGVIGPLACFQAEGSAAYHVRNGLKAFRPLELERRADGVSDRQAQQAATVSLCDFHVQTS